VDLAAAKVIQADIGEVYAGYGVNELLPVR
jgi:hypothetical protein